MADERRKKVDELVDCPWCGKSIRIEAGNEILVAGVKAETQPYVDVKKETQTKLEEKGENGKKKGRTGFADSR